MAISNKIDDDLKVRLQALADVRRRSPTVLVNEAISEFVEREEARERFRQDALDSWERYQQTGLHLTGDEVRSWLETWGTDVETAPPDCHG